MGDVAKITFSPKSEFDHFLSPCWGSFWNQNLSKMALGLAMGRPGGSILGFLLEPFSVQDAIQGRPGRKTDDFGGVCLQSLFVEEILCNFWRGSGQ